MDQRDRHWASATEIQNKYHGMAICHSLPCSVSHWETSDFVSRTPSVSMTAAQREPLFFLPFLTGLTVSIICSLMPCLTM